MVVVQASRTGSMGSREKSTGWLELEGSDSQKGLRTATLGGVSWATIGRRSVVLWTPVFILVIIMIVVVVAIGEDHI